jgi:hypothetical protein
VQGDLSSGVAADFFVLDDVWPSPDPMLAYPATDHTSLPAMGSTHRSLPLPTILFNPFSQSARKNHNSGRGSYMSLGKSVYALHLSQHGNLRFES